jgi:peptidoglycan biosynthesis protein MviN/MurJ (putative lipid II flippase)
MNGYWAQSATDSTILRWWHDADGPSSGTKGSIVLSRLALCPRWAPWLVLVGLGVTLFLVGTSPIIAVVIAAVAFCSYRYPGAAVALPASAMKAWNEGRGRYLFAATDGFVMAGVLCFAVLATRDAWGVWPLAMALPIACGIMLTVQWLGMMTGNGGAEPDAHGAPERAGRQVFLAIAAFNVLHQVNMIAVNAFMSGVSGGAIAWFNFSYNIAQIPVSIVDLVVMSAFFPFAAQLNRAGERATFAEAYVSISRLLVLALIPASVWLWLTRYDLVQIVFERGLFDRTATESTALCLAGMGLAIFPWAFESFGYRCLFALRQYGRYAGIIAIRTAANVTLCVPLVSRFGAAGVVVSFCISYWIGALLTSIAVAHELRDHDIRLIRPEMIFRAAGSSMLVVALHAGLSQVLTVPSVRVFLNGFVCILAVAAWYAAVNHVHKVRNAHMERAGL